MRRDAREGGVALRVLGLVEVDDSILLVAAGDVVARVETEARKRAEHATHDSALKAGILEHARRNAAHTVRALATSFGYDQVTIDWRRE